MTLSSPLQLKSLAASDSPPKIDFFNLEYDELKVKLGGIAGKTFHGESFIRFVHKQNIKDALLMSSLPTPTRPALRQAVNLDSLPILRKLVSKDGTVKFLFQVQTPKGIEEIESVYIPESKRVTLCVSSQVGCKMACRFCLTAQLGFKAHLSAGDIVRQIETVNRDPDLRPVTNIVFMGMGEPFDNFEEVKKATRILTDARRFDLSAKRITVSTVGLVPKIHELTKEDPFRLAVSLNATTDETRAKIMPVNQRYPLSELIEACRLYSNRTNKRVTFEYILMKDLSDSSDDARRLIRLLSPLRCKVNLIPYNESSFTEFKRPSEERILSFHKTLLDRQLPVFIRKNRGNDIFAACGMLRKVGTGPEPSPN